MQKRRHRTALSISFTRAHTPPITRLSCGYFVQLPIQTWTHKYIHPCVHLPDTFTPWVLLPNTFTPWVHPCAQVFVALTEAELKEERAEYYRARGKRDPAKMPKFKKGTKGLEQLQREL